MNDTLKMYGSIGSEIMNRYFVVAMCFKRQPRWRRLQTINYVVPGQEGRAPPSNRTGSLQWKRIPVYKNCRKLTIGLICVVQEITCNNR